MYHHRAATHHWPFGDTIYREFLHNFVDEMYLHDDQGLILDVNQAVCDNLGLPRERIVGAYVHEFSQEQSQEQLLDLWRNQPVGRNLVSHNTMRRGDGSPYSTEVHIACQMHNGRKYFFALCRNIDAQLQRDREIEALHEQLEAVINERTRQWQESTQLLETIMEQTPDVVFLKDPQGRYQYVNPAFLRVLSTTRERVIGYSDAQLLSPDLAATYALSDARALASAEPIFYEEQMPTQGQPLAFNAMKMALYDSEQRLHGLLGMLRDITEVQNTQKQLAHNYEMLCQAEKVTNVGSWTLDLATNTFTASEMLRTMNGLRPEDPPLTPQSLQTVIQPQDHALLSAAIARCIQDGTPYSMDLMHKRPEGGYFPCRIRGKAYRDAQGRINMLHGTLQDLTEHMEAQNRLNNLADNLPNGAIFRCSQTPDKKVVPVYLSAGIQTLLGRSAASIIQDPRRFTQMFAPDDLLAYLHAVQHAIAHDQNFDHTYRMQHANGSWHWIRIRASCREWLGQQYWEGLLLDVTAEQEAQYALQRAKDAAEAGERAKSEFLATMSHEIRTPMNTVLGMTQLLQQTAMQPKQRNYVDKISRAANALLAIINDILDFSKLEAEMLHLAPAPFMLEELLETVSNLTTLRAEEKGLEVVYAIGADVPSQLTGDMQRLLQVLTNLLSNAIKFTTHGEVLVKVQRQPPPQLGTHDTDDTPAPDPGLHDPQALTLRVIVQDTGIGIAPAHLARLFQPFTQAEAHISRRFGGTGLGLSISRKLVQLMGGDIHVHSQPNVGSEFSFTVQLRTHASAQPQPTPLPQHLRVLVVDDNATARESLLHMLNTQPLHSDCAPSGPQALHMLHHASTQGQPYHLVLMDWRMPEMDGLQVAERIRSHQHLSHTPAILMVTAYGRDEVLERVQALGLQGLLIKPVTTAALFSAMQTALQRPHAHPTDAAPNPSTDPSTDPSTGPSTLAPSSALRLPASLVGRHILVVDDNAWNREVAQDLLELAHIHVTCASSGQQALALLETQPFDAVLLDVQMPEMDGLTVARLLRQRPALHHLLVLALTAQASPQERRSILASGMDGHLSKPIAAQNLYDTLHLRLQHRPHAVPPNSTRPQRTSTSATATAPAAANAQQQARATRLLQAFLRDFSDTPAHMATLHTQHDRTALEMLAHTLKGSLGYLHQPTAVQAMAALEQHCRHDLPPHTLVAQAADALQAVLQQVRALLDSSPTAATPTDTDPSGTPVTDWQPVLHDMAQALPLILQGEYQGVRLLERIEAALRGHPLHKQALQALQSAEDLDSPHAHHLLAHLQQALLRAQPQPMRAATEPQPPIF